MNVIEAEKFLKPKTNTTTFKFLVDEKLTANLTGMKPIGRIDTQRFLESHRASEFKILLDNPLKELLNYYGLTQYYLQKEVGLSQSTVSKLISDNRPIGSFQFAVLLKIAEATNRSVGEVADQLKEFNDLRDA
ncbi:helix-turn-helix domain-containing protein [Listeria seeligeri]|uniref:helix-turn-helix domain-containing protein n=1 Tax=Listeria seeligeri TaxID=1640 RepID=UPI001886D229|nr:helix-turn-helix transcriptional regulator [Listeria seeligeri]MBF2355994.1 helix-turn-helix transcriptional regulator [Listeria seeligeri]MBF2375161.1 helix-turn-helix transcriptional regulator [Listeria seeligeri]UCK61838.1 XRE family transcriptional regulator [Listeria seeligeri]